MTVTITDLSTLPLVTVKVDHRHMLPAGTQGDTKFLMADPRPGHKDVLLVSAAGNPNVRGFWDIDGVVPGTEMVVPAGTQCWWMLRDGVEPATAVTEPVAPVDREKDLLTVYDFAVTENALRTEIAMLRDGLTRAREDTQQERQRHIADIALIGERLLEEAEERDWCEAFDEALAELNSNLNIALPTRVREVEVEVSGFLRVPFTQTVTITKTYGADPEEQAMEAFSNSYGASDVSANDYDAEFTDESEWTTEEV